MYVGRLMSVRDCVNGPPLLSSALGFVRTTWTLGAVLCSRG
jgi:hypothetical protein